MEIRESSIKERILHCFPVKLQSDVMRVTGILPMGLDMFSNAARPPTINNFLVSTNVQPVALNGESLKIPDRIYFNEPAPGKREHLTTTQKTILDCLYTRHHNGFVRQRKLEQLMGKSSDFIIPYTIQLLGEYVLEIIEDLQNHIFSGNSDKYVNFIRENPAYWIKTKCRVTSYWNAYYRHPQYPDYATPKYGSREEYIGQVIVNGLEKAARD